MTRLEKHIADQSYIQIRDTHTRARVGDRSHIFRWDKSTDSHTGKA